MERSYIVNSYRLLALAIAMSVMVACDPTKKDHTAPAPAQETKPAQPAQPGAPGQPNQPGRHVPGDQSGTGSDSTSEDGSDEGQSDGRTVCEIRATQGGEEVKKLMRLSNKYTAAAGNYDQLRDDLTDDLYCQKRDVKLANMKFAATVERANVLIHDNGEVMVNVHFKKEGQSQQTAKVSLVGNLEDRRSFGRAELIAHGAQAKNISGTIECMDANGACRTALVELVVGNSKGKSRKEIRKLPRMQIIFRQSTFNFTPTLDSATAGSAAYSKLVDLMVNYRQKVRSTAYYTYEVIGGKSGFRIIVMSKQNEMLIFEGDLLNQAEAYGRRPKLRAQPDVRETDEFFSAGRQADMKLMESLLEPRLVDSDNQGHVSIEFKTSSDRRGTAVIFGAEHYGLNPIRDDARQVFE